MDPTETKLEELIAYGSKAAIIQNLKDAGCSQETIDCCLACLDTGRKKELLERLEKHRKGILDKIHKGQKQIDCLDYLVFQIGRCIRYE
ncbi:MAG: hypothetical protein KH449_11550 [Lachnospiraceae bacterium]|jgi:hypothetical protein|nr:hypothetical protein [Lachnospiraceae bacterium]